MKVYSPPEFPDIEDTISIFLGGTIDMGNSEDWQAIFIDQFRKAAINSNININRYTALNPRRKEWDSSWKQSIKEPEFFQQVTWELTYLERATVRIFHFAENSFSPITLLEMGKFSQFLNTYVSCHPTYKRIGNLEIFCHRYKVPLYQSFMGSIHSILKTFK